VTLEVQQWERKSFSVGDWILYGGKGYKVYTDVGFRRAFRNRQLGSTPMAVNVFNAGDASAQGAASHGTANPGGTHG
jgi:hypothetical protein